jgi:hypothetical protein
LFSSQVNLRVEKDFFCATGFDPPRLRRLSLEASRYRRLIVKNIGNSPAEVDKEASKQEAFLDVKKQNT